MLLTRTRRAVFALCFSLFLTTTLSCSSDSPTQPKLGFLDATILQSSGQPSSRALIGLVADHQAVQLEAADTQGHRTFAAPPGDYIVAATDPHSDEGGRVSVRLLSGKRVAVTITLAP